MTEQIGDLLQVRTARVKTGRERVTQSVRARPSHGQAATTEDSPHGLAQAGKREWPADETAVPNKKMVTDTSRRSSALHIPAQRIGDVGREREMAGTIRFSRRYDEARRLPRHIREPQLRDFLRAQSQIEQAQCDRVVALPARVGSRECTEKPKPLRLGQDLDGAPPTVVGHVRHGPGELNPTGTLQMHETEKTSQRAQHHVGGARPNTPAKLLGKAPDVGRSDTIPSHPSCAKLGEQETPGVSTAVDARVGGEAAISGEKAIVAVEP